MMAAEGAVAQALSTLTLADLGLTSGGAGVGVLLALLGLRITRGSGAPAADGVTADRMIEAMEEIREQGRTMGQFCVITQQKHDQHTEQHKQIADALQRQAEVLVAIDTRMSVRG